jgi:hypothetical protein
MKKLIIIPLVMLISLLSVYACDRASIVEVIWYHEDGSVLNNNDVVKPNEKLTAIGKVTGDPTRSGSQTCLVEAFVDKSSFLPISFYDLFFAFRSDKSACDGDIHYASAYASVPNAKTNMYSETGIAQFKLEPTMYGEEGHYQIGVGVYPACGVDALDSERIKVKVLGDNIQPITKDCDSDSFDIKVTSIKTLSGLYPISEGYAKAGETIIIAGSVRNYDCDSEVILEGFVDRTSWLPLTITSHESVCSDSPQYASQRLKIPIGTEQGFSFTVDLPQQNGYYKVGAGVWKDCGSIVSLARSDKTLKVKFGVTNDISQCTEGEIHETCLCQNMPVSYGYCENNIYTEDKDGDGISDYITEEGYTGEEGVESWISGDTSNIFVKNDNTVLYVIIGIVALFLGGRAFGVF